jgi:hypothetical protein
MTAGVPTWLMMGTRAAMVCFGLSSVAWGVFVAPLVWHQTSIAQTAKKVIGGETYQPGFLATFAEVLAQNLRRDVCQPLVRRTLAVIRLRLAEEAFAGGDADQIRQTSLALESALQDSFACTPTDPYLWLAVFWSQNNTRGLQQDNFRSLRLSYRYGPNEGWLALRRNRYAVAIFPALPDDLKTNALDEFRQLVKSDFITDAADIIVGPGRPISDLLLARLDGIDVQKLRFLARLLDGKGFEANIPGVQNARRFPSG